MQHTKKSLMIHCIRFGKNRAISGKSNRRILHITRATNSGITPLNMVSRGTSLATPWTTYTLMPTGGVITPISPINTITTPNHIRSNPRVWARGAKIGTVSMIRAKASMKQPPNRYIRMITTMITEGGKDRLPAQADSSKGTRVTAMK